MLPSLQAVASRKLLPSSELAAGAGGDGEAIEHGDTRFRTVVKSVAEVKQRVSRPDLSSSPS